MMFTEDERVDICRMCDEVMSGIVDEAALVTLADRAAAPIDRNSPFALFAEPTLAEDIETLFADWSRYAAIYNKATLGALHRDRALFDENLEFAIRSAEKHRAA